MTVIHFSDGFYIPPGGVLGGFSGQVYNPIIRDAKTRKKLWDGGNDKPYVIKEDEVWEACGTTAGGFGDPLDRDPEMVRQDAREEIITVETAREVYGVVLDTEPELYAVDYEATGKLREELRKKPAEERDREHWDKFRKKYELAGIPKELEQPRDPERARRWAEEVARAKAERGYV